MQLSVQKIKEMIKDVFKPEPNDDQSVIKMLETVKDEIREIRANIDAVNDERVLDMYIYRLKAAQEEYKNLLKMAKENEKKTG